MSRHGVAGLWRIPLAAFVLAAPAHAQEAALTTLDGRRVAGRLAGLSPEAVVIETPDGPTSVPAGAVSRLELDGDHRPANDALSLGRAELVDGSRVAITGVTASPSEFQLALAPPLATPDGQTLSVPYSAVKAVVFRAESPELARQWESVRTVDATADLIVVVRKEGAVLDYLEGIVAEITAESLRVDLGGRVRDVSRSKVYGVVYFRPDAPAGDAEATLRIALRSGGVVNATRVAMTGERVLEITSPLGFRARLPVEACSEIDYSRGRVAYLSDLEPEEVNWRPYFPPPGDAALVDQWGRARRNQSYASGPLTLRTPSGETTVYAKGLAIRSRGELVYRVPAGFRWLRATVGLDPEPAVVGSVALRIEADGRVLFAETITSADAPRDLELPIDGAQRVRVLVDYGDAGDTGDNLHLANARFTK